MAVRQVQSDGRRGHQGRSRIPWHVARRYRCWVKYELRTEKMTGDSQGGDEHRWWLLPGIR